MLPLPAAGPTASVPVPAIAYGWVWSNGDGVRVRHGDGAPVELRVPRAVAAGLPFDAGGRGQRANKRREVSRHHGGQFRGRERLVEHGDVVDAAVPVLAGAAAFTAADLQRAVVAEEVEALRADGLALAFDAVAIEHKVGAVVDQRHMDPRVERRGRAGFEAEFRVAAVHRVVLIVARGAGHQDLAMIAGAGRLLGEDHRVVDVEQSQAIAVQVGPRGERPGVAGVQADLQREAARRLEIRAVRRVIQKRRRVAVLACGIADVGPHWRGGVAVAGGVCGAPRRFIESPQPDDSRGRGAGSGQPRRRDAREKANRAHAAQQRTQNER
jgi:hypothetical protein